MMNLVDIICLRTKRGDDDDTVFLKFMFDVHIMYIDRSKSNAVTVT